MIQQLILDNYRGLAHKQQYYILKMKKGRDAINKDGGGQILQHPILESMNEDEINSTWRIKMFVKVILRASFMKEGMQ